MTIQSIGQTGAPLPLGQDHELASRGPAPSDIAVAIEHFALGGRTLFRNFTMGLDAGRCTCILGVTGVGKTSLLHMIGGLLPGATLSREGAAFTCGVALMAQQDQLLPWLTAEDNVLLGYRLRGARRSELRRLRIRAGELLAQLGLGDRRGSLPVTLSGGMRQRVALARTLIEDRPLVLMDEPFSALDAITRYRLQELAANLLKGRTVVLVTHSPREALRLGDRVIVLGGTPARALDVFRPPGRPPRPIDDPAASDLEARLLRQLALLPPMDGGRR
ncbi:ABC transporter ATP-binding protein [Inquilinus sp. CA228]|uniref:ABC transporter ATP-binding protein n=1 Tax=Inquilinus sp. CA228 TaxID=3455609 RepID=UPI003F8D72C4